MTSPYTSIDIRLWSILTGNDDDDTPVSYAIVDGRMLEEIEAIGYPEEIVNFIFNVWVTLTDSDTTQHRVLTVMEQAALFITIQAIIARHDRLNAAAN